MGFSSKSNGAPGRPGKSSSGASRDHRKLPVSLGRQPAEKNTHGGSLSSPVTAARWRCTDWLLITRSPGTPHTAAALISEQPRHSAPQLDDLCGHFPVAVAVPGRHQRAPTLEQVAASVAAFDRALDTMPERLLDHLMRKARSLVAPIFEA